MTVPDILDSVEKRSPLDDILDMLRVRGTLMANLHAHAPFGLRVPQAPGAAFHGVTAGGFWVRIPGQAPRELMAGDVMLLPTGAPHVIASEPTGPTRLWDRVAKAQAKNPAGEIILDGPGRSTHVICAAYTYDQEVAHPLLSLLPSVLYLSGQQMAEGNAVHSTLGTLGRELTTRSVGSGIVIDRLIDVLFVHVIRAWAGGPHAPGSSWLRALRDPAIARALSLLHASPGESWTIDMLARDVSLSRTTLTRRFTTLVGEPPLSYLTRWRIELAARHLRETSDAVSTIAHRVGYTSEFAFSRAFSRLRGRAPARYRAEFRREAEEVRERSAAGARS